MHIEIESKVLVLDDSFKESAVRVRHIRQGYIAHDGGNTVRIRIVDGKGVLTIKGPILGVIGRPEWEKELSLEEAEPLLDLCKGNLIDKHRYIIPAGERCFEVDEFHGLNEGLTLAEIELGSEDEAFERPSWLGEEVSADKRYFNSYLSRHPFKQW